jgi:hypothetical protein
MYTEWLVEAHYLMTFLKLSRAPHFTTSQKFTDIIAGTVLERMISSFIALLISVNHIFLTYSIIPPRNIHVPIWRTHGTYRKQMKRGYVKLLYNQRNKDETIMSVIKRLFGEYVTSRLVRTQNREISLRCIAYNMHRLTNLFIIV